MKLMGVDYGVRRTGVALSDDGGVIAFPHDTLDTTPHLVAELSEIVKEKGVGMIALGDGKGNIGQVNAVEALIVNFKEELEQATGVPVELVGEMFSSFEAHGRQGKESRDARKTKIEKGNNIDAKAAAVILQRFIDIRPKADQSRAGN